MTLDDTGIARSDVVASIWIVTIHCLSGITLLILSFTRMIRNTPMLKFQSTREVERRTWLPTQGWHSSRDTWEDPEFPKWSAVYPYIFLNYMVCFMVLLSDMSGSWVVPRVTIWKMYKSCSQDTRRSQYHSLHRYPALTRNRIPLHSSFRVQERRILKRHAVTVENLFIFSVSHVRLDFWRSWCQSAVISF